MKKIAKKISSVAVIFGVLIFNFSAEALVIDDAKLQALKNAPLSQCPTLIQPLFETEMQSFLAFLQGNFSNKSASSSLTNIAISRYREYKIALEQILSNVNVAGLNKKVEVKINDVELQSYNECVQIKDFYQAAAKDQMIRHIQNSTAQKKTLVILEKYEAINEELRKLNLDIAQMYGFFMSFKERLPGFIQNCVKK